MVVLVVRSRKPLWSSRPAIPLFITTVAVIIFVIALPFTPLGGPLGFVPLPASFLVTMLAIVVAYAAAAEGVKRWFYRGLAD